MLVKSVLYTNAPVISFICSHVSRYYKTLFQREYKRINDRLLLSILHTPRFPHWNGKLKWKIDFFFHSAFSTLRIFYTPHFLHSAFSTLRIFYTPHSAYSTEPEKNKSNNHNATIKTTTVGHKILHLTFVNFCRMHYLQYSFSGFTVYYRGTQLFRFYLYNFSTFFTFRFTFLDIW